MKVVRFGVTALLALAVIATLLRGANAPVQPGGTAAGQAAASGQAFNSQDRTPAQPENRPHQALALASGDKLKLMVAPCIR